MPEELHPGVYVEEVSFRGRSIEGVATGAAGFVGYAERVEVDRPIRVHSFAEFTAHFGDAPALEQGGTSSPNFLALAAHGHFGNGGRELLVSAISPSVAPSVETLEAALERLREQDGISLVAAPGVSVLGNVMTRAVNHLLIDHAESAGRFALVEAAAGLDIAGIRQVRADYDSKYAALYYPWVQLADPLDPAGTLVTAPPSGWVCGAILRNDRERGIWKAPANLPMQGVTGLERVVTRAEQEILNPLGINCIRTFEGRGIRIWGARTLSSDSEWKYVSVRRYFSYLEQSIDKGTQWAVFEPNCEPLWANVRQLVEGFLLREWQNGALMGDRPDKAFFVKCDRSTMTQDDLDNGRLVMLIGIAPVKPAEFVIFRIGQRTAG